MSPFILENTIACIDNIVKELCKESNNIFLIHKIHIIDIIYSIICVYKINTQLFASVDQLLLSSDKHTKRFLYKYTKNYQS